MILEIAASLLCSVVVPSPGDVELIVNYLHEHPAGQRYTFRVVRDADHGLSLVTAEGHPYRIRVKQNGAVIGGCVYREQLYLDDFESGSADGWDKVTQ